MELPLLMSKEFPCNQENNDPFAMKTTSTDNASVDMHKARWSGLFDQMDKALFEEEKQLVSVVESLFTYFITMPSYIWFQILNACTCSFFFLAILIIVVMFNL